MGFGRTRQHGSADALALTFDCRAASAGSAQPGHPARLFACYHRAVSSAALRRACTIRSAAAAMASRLAVAGETCAAPFRARRQRLGVRRAEFAALSGASCAARASRQQEAGIAGRTAAGRLRGRRMSAVRKQRAGTAATAPVPGRTRGLQRRVRAVSDPGSVAAMDKQACWNHRRADQRMELT